MKKNALQLLLIALVVLSIAACKGREKADTNQTETMAPVAAQPAPTGTDAMTQTVDVEDSRSDAEGGGLTETSTAPTTTTAAATKTTTAKSVKKAPSKKH